MVVAAVVVFVVAVVMVVVTLPQRHDLVHGHKAGSNDPEAEERCIAIYLLQ